MATQGTPLVPFGDADHTADAALQRPWRMREAMSRLAEVAEGFLGTAGYDRGPWIVVAFAGGIGAWFALPNSAQWVAALLAALICTTSAHLTWRSVESRAHIRLAISAIGLAFAFGLVLIWLRSEMIGTPAIERPTFVHIDARILERLEQPSEQRVRLILATRQVVVGKALKVRVNVPESKDSDRLEEGARINLRARLMPPSPPLLPGGYDFARRAWFDGLAATGSLVGEITLVEPGDGKARTVAKLQRELSEHVRSRLSGSSGTIAAAFASGDRGAIARADEIAMRDAGLTHLLSISGLHVSAVIGAAYFLAIKFLALWPWLALRIRLPLVAAAIAAGTGIGYTLLTGAEVPTVRSCIGALLVLIALALGREPLSMRMVAVAAGVVLVLWPESLIGPSFQMSFSAVMAIVALHNARPVREFLVARQESWFNTLGRRVLMLFVTGLVIEIALTPIVLFHFHRAGLYGAFANVLAIPLVTFISMPLIAVALLLDLVGFGAPFWWLAGHSLDLLLGIARTTASQPGAVKLVPHIGLTAVLLFVAGGLWLALWRGAVRLLGLVLVLCGSLILAASTAPDILIAREGRDVGLVDDIGRLFVLRESKGSYAQENIAELAGTEGAPLSMTHWPGARCNADFCSLPFKRKEIVWHLLIARSRVRIDEMALAAACEKSDIVIADRWLPRSCRPKWLKADRRYLMENGGTVIYLANRATDTVAADQGEHGWWRAQGGK